MQTFLTSQVFKCAFLSRESIVDQADLAHIEVRSNQA